MKLSNPQIEDRINAQWDRIEKSRSLKMDWLGLETILRDVLSDTVLSDTEKVIASKEAIAAWTGRG